jgi:hypothetical protein
MGLQWCGQIFWQQKKFKQTNLPPFLSMFTGSQNHININILHGKDHHVGASNRRHIGSG